MKKEDWDMQNKNVKEIINEALLVSKTDLRKKIQKIVKEIEIVIKDNEKLIKEANQIDLKNNNGFLLDFDVINRIFSNLEKENYFYKDILKEEKEEKEEIVYGKELVDYGNVVTINDGNSYVILEMALKNIKAGNTNIFFNKGYMCGTNKLLIILIQSVLEKNDVSSNLVQMFVGNDYEEILSNYANIDLVIVVGNRSLQNEVLSKSKNKVITSGYDNFEIYLEDLTNLEFIKKIMNLGLNVELYVNSDINVDIDEKISVDSLEEGIAKINYNGSLYSSAIFTNNSNNASLFLEKIKANNVTVNVSPTLMRVIDIKQVDLMKEKTVIYPFKHKLDGTSLKFK